MTTVAAVHLVTGDDDHLLRRAVDDLLLGFREAIPDLDVDFVEPGDAEGLPELRTAGLFGGTRCVVVRGAESLGSLKKEVESYVEDPVDGAVFVLVARTRRPTGVLKLAAESGERHDVSSPAPWDESGWERLVRDEFARADRRPNAAAVRAILDRAGTDASEIASKCGQVIAATAAGDAVDAGDVERVAGGHGSRGGFAVADAVAARDPAAAIVATRGALEAGDAPLAVLGALSYRFRQLLQVRGGAGHKEAGMSPGQHRHVERATRAFQPGELAWCQDRLARADLELKGSDLDDDVVLELAVIDLATSREVGPPWNPLA